MLPLVLDNSSLGLINGNIAINIIAINNNEPRRNVNVPATPNPIAVPTNTAMYKIPTGILLLQAAANMARPNGANSPLKLTIDIRNATAYRIMSFILNKFFI